MEVQGPAEFLHPTGQGFRQRPQIRYCEAGAAVERYRGQARFAAPKLFRAQAGEAELGDPLGAQKSPHGGDGTPAGKGLGNKRRMDGQVCGAVRTSVNIEPAQVPGKGEEFPDRCQLLAFPAVKGDYGEAFQGWL